MSLVVEFSLYISKNYLVFEFSSSKNIVISKYLLGSKVGD